MTPERFARLEDLFAQAVALPTPDQEPFLAQATADDPSLLDDLRPLLAADASSRNHLGSAIDELARTAPPDEATPAWSGRLIGAYRLQHELGRGGMSIVFAAVREGDFSQQVAVKLSTLAPFSADLHERFRQERRILASLEHPHIARLIDGGTTPEGIPYLVTELCDGIPLQDYVAQHHPAFRPSCELFLKVCSAVEYAHQNLTVHRDLKPANILIDPSGSPKLIDFGIAKLLLPDSLHTQTNLSPGTRSYAAPEQLNGQPITTRTDIYQLGLVLYELLTGQRANGPRPIPKSLRGDIETILATALQEDPARRYRSVASLADDLRAHLDGRPISARADSASYRLGRFLRRNWLSSSAAAILALSILAGVISTTYQARIAERRFNQVRGIARALLYDVQGAIQVLPASIDAQQVVVRTALNYLNGLSAEASGDPGLQVEIAAGYSRIGTIQARIVGPSLDQRAAGQDSFQKALDLLEPLNRAQPTNPTVATELADVYLALLEIDIRSGRSALARQRGERAIQVMETAHAAHPEVARPLARAYTNFNRDIAGRSQVDTSIVLKPVNLLEPLLASAPNDTALAEETANAYAAAVAALFNAHKTTEAKPYAEKAATLREKVVAVQPDSAAARRALMLAYAALGDLHWGFAHSLGDRPVAIGYYQKMLAPAEWLQQKEPAKLSARTDFAMTRMRYAGALPPRDPRAIPMLSQSLQTVEAIVAEDPANHGVGRQQIDLCIRLAARYSELEDSAGAQRFLRRGIEVGETMARADAKNIGARTWGLRAYVALGRELVRVGQRAQAIALIPKAEAIAKEAYALDASPASGGRWPTEIAKWANELRTGS
jgi:eukaryotic-like serine/threonine-protein kinase